MNETFFTGRIKTQTTGFNRNRILCTALNTSSVGITEESLDKMHSNFLFVSRLLEGGEYSRSRYRVENGFGRSIELNLRKSPRRRKTLQERRGFFHNWTKDQQRPE